MAARTGLVVGFAIVTPVMLWLAAEIAGHPNGNGHAQATIADALRALWIAQAIAVALAAPRGIDTGWRGRVVGVGVLIAVAFPLLVMAWLAEATTGTSVARGFGLQAACTSATVLLASAVERAAVGEQARRVGLAATEVGLATALWAFRGTWLGWVTG